LAQVELVELDHSIRQVQQDLIQFYLLSPQQAVATAAVTLRTKAAQVVQVEAVEPVTQEHLREAQHLHQVKEAQAVTELLDLQKQVEEAVAKTP
jgi:hypothetical protein